MPAAIWRLTNKAINRAGPACAMALAGTPLDGKYIVEIVLVPKYATVEMRKALWRLRRHPNKTKGLALLKLVAGVQGEI